MATRRERSTTAAIVRASIALAPVVASVPAHAASDDLQAPRAIEDTRGIAGVALSTRAGVATAPFASTTFPEARGHALVTALSAHGAIAPWLWLGVRVSLVTSSVAQPAGSYLDEAAWGNPQLYAVIQTEQQLRETMSLRTVARLSVGAPLAEHGPSGWLLENRGLAIANAIDGWRHPELYTPGVVPLHAALQLDLVSMPWVASGAIELPILLRVSDADLSPERTREIGISPILGAAATYWVKRIGLTLGAHVAVQALRIDDPPRPGSRTQVVIDPQISWRASEHALFAADVVIPLGSPLGGATFGLGVHAAMSL